MREDAPVYRSLPDLYRAVRRTDERRRLTRLLWCGAAEWTLILWLLKGGE